MTTPMNNTGNEVGSTDPRDLLDNAQVLDGLLNGDKVAVISRTGKELKAWEGIEADANNNLALQEIKFQQSLKLQEGHFQDFLSTSGYIFLGDYESGPLHISARNEYIRYDNQYWKLNSATDVGFTTTGTNAASWASDVTHFALIDGDTLRQELSGTGGASLSGLKQGGTVQQALVSVYVDGFGADPTGLTDSTSAVIEALNSINGVIDSSYKPDVTKYSELVFGNGTYVIGDVPLHSGVCIRGQGQFATRIMPKAGAAYCFTSVGVSSNSGSTRMFQSSLKGMTIGPGYQGTSGAGFKGKVTGVGGVRILAASYLTMTDVAIRYMDGCGLWLGNVWDTDFHNVRIMDCGNITNPASPVPGLLIGPGDSADDGCNAIRLSGLHIETCPQLIQILSNTRHIFLISPKIEAMESDAVSSIISGVGGVTFVSPELTWGRSDAFMFDITAGNSRGVQVVSPSIICLASKIANIFKYASTSAPLEISNPFARSVRCLAEGSNIKITGGVGSGCGPVFVNGTDNITVDNLTLAQTTMAVGYSPIQVNGKGLRLTDNKFEFSSTNSNGISGVYIGPLCTDALATGNIFSGATQTAMAVASEVSASANAIVHSNFALAGANIPTVVTAAASARPLSLRGNGEIPYPFTYQTSLLSASGGTLTLGSERRYANKFLISVTWTQDGITYTESAEALVNNSSASVLVTASLRGVVKSGESGITTPAFVYLTLSGSNIIFTNMLAYSATIRFIEIRI